VVTSSIATCSHLVHVNMQSINKDHTTKLCHFHQHTKQVLWSAGKDRTVLGNDCAVIGTTLATASAWSEKCCYSWWCSFPVRCDARSFHWPAVMRCWCCSVVDISRPRQQQAIQSTTHQRTAIVKQSYEHGRVQYELRTVEFFSYLINELNNFLRLLRRTSRDLNVYWPPLQ